MKRFLLYYINAKNLAYVPEAQALLDVRAGSAILDRLVLEADFTVRHIRRDEERAFYAQEEPRCET